MKVLFVLQQMFRTEMNSSLLLTAWDFRDAPPHVVPQGQLATKSLTMVERSQAVMVILGDTVPLVTGEEVLKAFELRASGTGLEVWVFLRAGPQTDAHKQLFAQVQRIANEDVVYSQYADALEFQSKVFTTLLPYVLKRVESAEGPLFGGEVNGPVMA